MWCKETIRWGGSSVMIGEVDVDDDGERCRSSCRGGGNLAFCGMLCVD